MPNPWWAWQKASSGFGGPSEHPAIATIRDDTEAGKAFNRLLDMSVGHISPQEFGSLAEEHIGPGTGEHFTNELSNRAFQDGRQLALDNVDLLHEHLPPTMAHFIQASINAAPDSLNPSDASQGGGGSESSSSSGGGTSGGGGGGTSSGGGQSGAGAASVDPSVVAPGFSVGTGIGAVAAALAGAMFSGQAGAIGIGPGQAVVTENTEDPGAVGPGTAHDVAVQAAIAEAFGGVTAAADPTEGDEAGPAGLGGDPGESSAGVSDAAADAGSDAGGGGDSGGDSGD